MYYLAAEKNDWVYRVIASLLLFIMPNANEYFVGYGVVLLAVLVTRLIRERKNVYIIESVIHIAVVVWTIYSSYLAATQGAPTASLRMSVENLPYKKYYWIMLALVFASALLFLLAGIFSNVLFRILAALFAWGAVLWLGITVKDYTTLIATRSFSMRIMNLVLPCLCGGVIWLCWTFHVNMWDKIALFAAGMLILNNIYVCKSTGEYGDYLSQISAACDERQGFFTVYETNVDRTYMWGWSLPMEGVLAQCLDGKTGLKSVMIKGFDADWWESFDSDDINAYGDFSRYGITFDFGNV